MKKLEDVKTPNCPSCGQFMDMVEALVTEQLSEGTVPISIDINDTVMAWVCPKEKCRKLGNSTCNERGTAEKRNLSQVHKC